MGQLQVKQLKSPPSEMLLAVSLSKNGRPIGEASARGTLAVKYPNISPERWVIGINRSKKKTIAYLPGLGNADLDLRECFTQLKDQWKRETMLTSSSHSMILNRNYQRIIGLGPTVLPLLLREMEEEPDHWHWALNAITGVDPVPPEKAGQLSGIAEAWLSWAREKGLYPKQEGSRP